MKGKDKLIVTLIIFGVILFGIVQFIVIPHSNKVRQKYLTAQQDATTHDIKSIIKYKNKYMGNASNIINLFYNLPLASVPKNFQLHSEKLTLEVNYKDTIADIGEEKSKRALIYNSAAAFALVDNLQHIQYNFKGASFIVDRKNIEAFYDEFGSILKDSNWKHEVQDKLYDETYVNTTFNSLIKTATIK